MRMLRKFCGGPFTLARADRANFYVMQKSQEVAPELRFEQEDLEELDECSLGSSMEEEEKEGDPFRALS